MVVFHLLSVLSHVTWRGETNLFVKPCSHQMTVTAKAMSLQFKLLIQIQKVQIQLYFYLSFNRSESESTRKLLNCHWFCCCVCFSRCEQRIQLILSMDDSIDKGTLNLPLELQRKILHVSLRICHSWALFLVNPSISIGHLLKVVQNCWMEILQTNDCIEKC